MIREKIVIAGAGLGGLLSGALLSKYGYKPLLIESLNEVGGRFRNLNYKAINFLQELCIVYLTETLDLLEN